MLNYVLESKVTGSFVTVIYRYYCKPKGDLKYDLIEKMGFNWLRIVSFIVLVLIVVSCIWTIIQSCSVYISIHTYSHEHNNITISSNIHIQLHVSALYVGHHQVVQGTY